MYCTNCGNAISDSAVVCPFCNATVDGPPTGQKAPGWEGPLEEYDYSNDFGNDFGNVGSGSNGSNNDDNNNKKKTIIIIVAVVMALLLIGGGVVSYFLFFHEKVKEYFENKDETVQGDIANEDNNAEENVTADNDDNASDKKEPESLTPDEYNSKAAEFYVSMSSSLAYCTYNVTEDSVEFINNNEKYFPCSDADFDALAQTSTYYSYPELSKSVAKYDAMMVNTDYMYVSQIYETENGEYTYICAYDDEGYGFVGVLYGVADGVYEGDYVKIYGTPLAKVDFTNYYGASEPGIFFAISYCEKMTEEEYEEQSIIEQLQTDPVGYFTQNDYYAPYVYQVMTQTGDNLRLREWCTTETDDNVITLLKHESLVYVYGFYDGWAYVTTYDGPFYEGWVSEDFIYPYYAY